MFALYLFCVAVIVWMVIPQLGYAYKYYKRGDKWGVWMTLAMILYGIVGVSAMTYIIMKVS